MAHGDKKDTLTRDIYESVRSVLGKNVKILERCSVRLETKGDKTESRILVFTPCRLFVFTSKIPTKIDFNIHYLDLQAIESKKLSQLTLSTSEKAYSFHTQEELNQTSDSLISAIVTAISDLFPGIPIDQVIRRIELSPVGRIENLSNLLRGSAGDNELSIPCGNFSRQYACMCDYYGLPYREEVAWDVDTIYMSHNSKELNLRDFDHLDPKDLIPIIAALELNSYFLRFRCSHLKLSHECCDRLLAVLKKSTTLEEVCADNVGIKGDFANKLSMAFLSNTNSSLQGLDLSHNLIEDRGACHLGNSLAKVQRGLTKLALAQCGLTGKGVAQIGQTLSVNKFMSSSLVHLDLSSNAIKDEMAAICSFLAQPNVLAHLNLANTETSLEPIFSALLRGCTSRLSHLDLSKNSFSTKKGKELPPSFKQYFTSSLALHHVALAQCKITPEALKNLLLGLACNETIGNVLLDLSNNILGNGGCHVLESCIHGVRCLSTLDISDNGIDVEMAGVLLAICRNKSLKHLVLNKNFQSLKSKHAATVIDAFVHLLQEEDCVIETLGLIDCKLKSELYSLINAVGSNQSLIHLDLTGNFIGDPGARLLSKALQINTSVQTLSIDRNSITVHGYSDIAYALESNRTLRYLPYPLHDIMVAAKAGTEKVDALWKQIQESLQRNMASNVVRTVSNPVAVKSPPAPGLSSFTRHALERLVGQTGDAIRNIQRQACDDAKAAEIEVARGLLDDARCTKQLFSKLVDCAESAAATRDISADVGVMLQPVVGDVQAALTSHLQNVGDELVRCARSQCSTLMSSATLTDQLKKSVDSRSLFPAAVVQSALVDGAVDRLLEKTNEMAAAMALQVGELLVDQLIESLTDAHQSLTGDVAPKKRSSTPDVLKSRTRLSSEPQITAVSNEPLSLLDQDHRHQDPVGRHSPVATPQLPPKRKNQPSRKLRPKSVVGLLHDDGATKEEESDVPDLVPPRDEAVASQVDAEADANEEEVGVCVDDVNDPASVTSAAASAKRSTPLKHLGLSRPKKPKTRLPTRSGPTHRLTNSQTASQESLDGLEADLSQGLDTFFHSATMATTTGGSSASLGSSRMPGSLGSVSSAELGSPSLDSISADSSPMHHRSGATPAVASTSASTPVVGATVDESTNGSREDFDADEEKDVDKSVASKEKRKDSGGRGMGVRLLSSIFGKNSTSPSPTNDATTANPATKSPVARTRLGSLTSKEPADGSQDVKQPQESEDSSTAAKKLTPKLGVGVGGNVLAEMKARQERRISGIIKQNSTEESDLSERSEMQRQVDVKANMSPLPLGAMRLRPTLATPEDVEPSKSVEVRPAGSEKAGVHPLANIRLRPRCFTDESPEAAATKSDVALHPFRLRAASGAGLTDNPPESEPNPLIGVRLRSTGINVTDPLKSPNNGAGPTTSSVGSPSDAGGEAKNDKNESRNSLSKLKPPPLAPKPRPWSIVGSDKKADDAENAETTKESDAAKDLTKPASKVRAMAATLNSTNSDVARRTSKPSLTDSEELDERPVDPHEQANDPAAKTGRAQVHPHSASNVQLPPLVLDNYSLEEAVDV